MKARLLRLWFPRLRAARADRDYWMVAASWARVEHQLARQIVTGQRAAMKRQADRHLALREQIDALCVENARLRDRLAAADERVAS